MANRQRAEARRKAQAKAHRFNGEEGGGTNKMAIWIGVIVVIAFAAGVIVFASRGDDSKADPSVTTQNTSGLASLPDSQPVTVTGAALPALDAAANPDPAIGMDAPLLSGLNFSGTPIVMDPATKGPYMLVFLAHWCVHCNAEVPRLINWKNSGGVPAGLNIIGVPTAVSETAPNYPPAVWFSNKGWPFPALVDEKQGDGAAGKAATAYGASGWPYFVIVGADGKVKARVSGEVEISDLQTIVDTALAT
ncbi:MAG TPA: TlpA disulfide reductase family protein [Ilumatobacteraceae bacterium]|nr:TlpA disulfide reductase family protein [Ilumatobacteraceae bacterium]